jgi:ankyrin repeat protein
VHGNLRLLQKLWEWGKETTAAEDVNNNLLLVKDDMEQTAWHLAAGNGKLTVLQKVWEWGKETLTAQELNSKLLLAQGKGRQTSWHLAAKNANIAVLQKLCEWANELKINLKNELVFAKDKDGKTALELVRENKVVREAERLKAIELIENYL